MTATYTGPSGRKYRLTNKDMLWAVRMIVGEGGENAGREESAAYMWAMMNRFMLLGKWGTFTELLRKFSQPINPIWARDGKMCRPGGKYHGTDHCSEARLVRREKTTNLSWEEAPSTIKYFVREFAGGILPQPAKWGGQQVTNWGAKTLTNKRNGVDVPIPELYPWGFGMFGEWFFKDEGVKGGPIEVTDADGPLPAGPRAIGFLGALTITALGLALGAGTWLAYRIWIKK